MKRTLLAFLMIGVLLLTCACAAAPESTPTEPTTAAQNDPDQGLVTEPTTAATEPTDPKTEENTDADGKYTLTVEAPSDWTTVNVYTWDPEAFGTWPGSAMTKESGNTYQYGITDSVRYLVISNQDGAQTADLQVSSGCDIHVVIASDNTATVTYPNGGGSTGARKPAADDPVGELSDYRVVGNADWLGNWDPAFEGGRMTKVSDNLYRKNFENVPAGSYEIKVTKDGKWGGDIGDNGNNYIFTVQETATITVDLRLSGDTGTIDVYGDGTVPEL